MLFFFFFNAQILGGNLTTATVEIFMLKKKVMLFCHKVSLNKVRKGDLLGFQPKF